MAENLTGKFDSLSQAEAAATKLRSIRVQEVDISEWNGPGGDRDNSLEAYSSMRASFLPPGGNNFPITSGLSSGGFSMMPYGMMGDYMMNLGGYSPSFLLNALVTGEEREKAIRIIRECGGKEI